MTKPNRSASFMMMRDTQVDPGYLSGPNQWPGSEVCEAYVETMTQLARGLMSLAIDAIGASDRPDPRGLRHARSGYAFCTIRRSTAGAG